MPDSDILISELPSASQVNTDDLVLLTQPDAQSDTGYISKKGTALEVFNKALKGVNYSTDLASFTNRTVLGGMAELKSEILPSMNIGTASGAIASFKTDYSENLIEIKCQINATGGNGTPDNPNPINGYTEANITRCGVNFFDKDTVTSGRIINGGGNDVSFTGWNVSDYIPVKEGAEFYLYGLTDHPNTNQDNFIFFDASKTKIGFANVKTWEYPLTIPSGAKFVKCTCKDIDLNTAQFSLTNNAPYEAYNGQTYAIAFGQTVYGGVLDVTRGKLKPCVEYPSYNGETLSGRWLSSEATYIEGTTPPTGSQVVSLDDYGVDIDLTPEVISAVVGTNNVYSDTNGDTDVKYYKKYSLQDLDNVVISSASSGQVLKYDGTNWINGTGGGGGASALNDLTDVTITSASNGQFLKYNGSKWVNGSGGSTTLSGLTDVTITTASSGQVLKYNGSVWVNDSSSAPWVDVTGTLTAGNTSLTLNNAAITTSSTIDVFTDTFGVNPTNMSVSTGSVTLTFDSRGSDLGVKVRIS